MRLFSILLSLFPIFSLQAQHSVARQWNEKVLFAISKDFARPTIHARNLFHTSVAMYDAWAVYSPEAETYMLGKTVHGFNSPYHTVPTPVNVKAAQEEAISFAVYRLIRERFVESPGWTLLQPEIDKLMMSLGYDIHNESTNYKRGPAEMGNYIAQQIIAFGLQDGSNEVNRYTNQYYNPVNPPMQIELPGNEKIMDINRWQPLKFSTFIDQSGNQFNNFISPFLSPEWGNVVPFALQAEDAEIKERAGHNYRVYHDPGPPAMLDLNQFGGISEEFKWNFAFVTVWGALLDPGDGVMIDISPASIGNNSVYPTNLAGLHDFYDEFEGGDSSTGRQLNPRTGQPYEPQIVPRGDYTRVLAEFWADGPNSVTPPGHWFDMLNYINDQPGLLKKIRGTGPLCNDLEWDVKAYFTLGGAMHDAAISAWGIKGWYDSVRPVSAIRGMAELGQSSDPDLPHYHPGGLPLIPGYIEIIQAGDPLQGVSNQYIGEVKLKTWKGPNYIGNPQTSVAGVGWIRAKNWWPYQRPTFVTPPFAGYVSGHSTYSRAAAEVLTELTGDEYFPGGLGEFHCKKNEYLVFEDGPSKDIVLQWATYRDASDQCSLSRIYGGIHPPMDDIPGRLIGIKIGQRAVDFAEQYFRKTTSEVPVSAFNIFPNPTSSAVQIEADYEGIMSVNVYFLDGRLAISTKLFLAEGRAILNLSDMSTGMYIVVGLDATGRQIFREKLGRL